MLHDNARPHTALSVPRFLTKHNVTVLPHPPYSPDLSPCDFFLFPRLKKRLKGWRHENIEAIQAASTMELTSIPKEAFTSCFRDLQKCWQQCTTAEGTTSKGTGSINCEVDFCIFYRPSLRTLRTKDVYCDVKGKICNFLNKFLHETLFPHPYIILIAFFCFLKIMELYEEFPQNIVP